MIANLETDRTDDADRSLHSAATIRFLTDYMSLERFARRLALVARGDANSAVLGRDEDEI